MINLNNCNNLVEDLFLNHATRYLKMYVENI
jgi:hypothetical protein